MFGKIKFIFLMVAVVAFLSGCGNYTDLKDAGDGEAPTPQGSLEGKTFSFSDIKAVVFQTSRCLECHSAGRGNRGGVNLETRAEAAKWADDIRFDIQNDIMPKGGPPMPLYERTILFAWLDRGAPENSNELLPPREGEVDPTPPETEPAPGPSEPPTAPAPEPTLTFGFETIKQLVFASEAGRCLNCHSEAKGNRGGVNLETFANVRAQLNDIKFDLEMNFMPRTGPPLPDYEKSVIFKWIEMGAPETSDVPVPAR